MTFTKRISIFTIPIKFVEMVEIFKSYQTIFKEKQAKIRDILNIIRGWLMPRF